MGKTKKKTKPPIPLKYRKATALWLAKRRAQKHEAKYTTLWEAAKDFIKTNLFKKIVKGIQKQMIAKEGEQFPFKEGVDGSNPSGLTKKT